MRVLALDLGTRTGWALQDDDLFKSGTWTLATPKCLRDAKTRAKADPRFMNLRYLIEEKNPLGAIYYENVQFASTQYQAQLWGGFRAIVTLFQERGARIVGVPVGTLKKFATGKGNATKGMMGGSLLQFGGLRYGPPDEKLLKKGIWAVERATQRPIDDNEVDAIHLLRYALQREQLKA